MQVERRAGKVRRQRPTFYHCATPLTDSDTVIWLFTPSPPIGDGGIMLSGRPSVNIYFVLCDGATGNAGVENAGVSPTDSHCNQYM